MTENEWSDEETIIADNPREIKTSHEDNSIKKNDAPKTLNDIEEQFELFECFDEGGQGYVSRGRDLFLNRSVAIKSLKEGLVESKKRSFCDEALLTAQLDHPSIIPIYSLNKDENDGYHFSMKLVKGVTLKEYFDKLLVSYETEGFSKFKEKLSLRKRLDIFLKICDAIAFAHSKGVVHCDLKPDNIMIGEFNEVYVMDWGIAVIPEEEEEEVRTEFNGTPGYIAPSIIKGAAPSPQSDIYSLGMILYQVVTLERGYIGKTVEQCCTNAKEGRVKEVYHAYDRAEISGDLVAIIEKARAVDPQDSYPNIQALVDDIRRYLINAETAARPDNIIRKFHRWIQHNDTKVIIATCIVLLVMALFNIRALQKQVELEKEAQIRQEKLSNYQSIVTKKAHKIDSYFSNIEHLLLDTSARLHIKEAGSSPLGASLYSSSDFSSEETRPKDTTFSKIFGKEVSIDAPGYKLAPGKNLTEVQGFLNYLYTFKKDFQNIIIRSEVTANRQLYDGRRVAELVANESMPVKWVYCGFDNGVFLSYPGKGGYPEAYDHRLRPWYKQAMKHEGLNWGDPYYDVNGLGLVLPCTYTIKSQVKEENGVFAVDVTLDFIIEDLMKNQDDSAVVEAVILNEDGKVVMSSAYESLNKKEAELTDKTVASKEYDNFAVRSAIRQGKKQLVLVETGGVYVYEIAEISTLNWYYLEKKALADL